PGMALLGMPEQLFVNTVFVKQLSDGKIDGVGMAEAVENLLMSGDEGVSTKKAIEKLERERISLKHKTGSGGLLNELQREAMRLKQKLSDASRESADIIELESSVEELGNTVAQREKECAYLARLCDAYDKINAKRRRDEAKKCAGEIREIDEKLESYGRYGDISESVKEIIELSADVKSTEEKQKILRRRQAELNEMLPPVMTEEEAEKAREDIETAKKASKKRGSRVFLGILFLIVGAAVIAADIIIDPPYHSVFLSTAAVIMIIAALLTGSGIINSRKFKKIMKSRETESVAELERTVERRIQQSAQRTDPNSEFLMTVSALHRVEAERISYITELRERASVFSPDMSDTDLMAENALEKAKKIAGEIEELKHRRNEVYGRYSVLADSLGTDRAEAADAEVTSLLMTETGKAAAAMTRDDADNNRKKKKFAENSLPSLRTQLSEKENRLGVLKATTAEPAAIAAQLETVEAQLKEATARYESIVLAIDTLKTAGDGLRRGLIPRVKNEAERIIGNFTDGKYTDLGVDRRFDITFDANGKTRDSVFFSAGTRDIAYISLRMALAHVLFSYNVPPVIYDESFARVDAERLRRILRFLCSAGENGVQSLLFTCRELEGELASELGDVKIINL
ncbi:MAG: hypothetical protein PUC29_04575, partial [Clostridia bacterium]|nr:hypothetical protein [Clostridia bacterium]